MADQKVELVDTDSKAMVAYKMARAMWVKSHAKGGPGVEDKDEFLSLVEDCVRALNRTDWRD